MDTLIIYNSIHHGNTRKIAEILAGELNARILKSGEANPSDIDKFDMVGFGSGIYMGKHHREILDFVTKLDNQSGKNAFIFSTSGMGKIPIINDMHKKLRTLLAGKGFCVVKEFNCPGWDTYPLFVRPFGGIKKGRPNGWDFEKAKKFAENLK